MGKHKPVGFKEKGRAVRQMFGEIAGRYDLMNRLMTFGQDQVWRRCVIQAAGLPEGGTLLDAGTGTGLIGREALKENRHATVVGSDFSLEMMQVGRRRASQSRMLWCSADALYLPFKDASFDVVTSGYLMRNVSDVEQALLEQIRVVKPGGRVVCLDTSPPPENFYRPVVLFFLTTMIPLLGQVISGNRSAYSYLPESTKKFFAPEKLARKMRAAGLERVVYRRYMFGTIAVHVATKPR